MHEWTCKAEQGIPPPKLGVRDIRGFYEYAIMYCDKCGKISDISIRELNKLNDREG